jgi:hypothetical protein
LLPQQEDFDVFICLVEAKGYDINEQGQQRYNAAPKHATPTIES